MGSMFGSKMAHEKLDALPYGGYLVRASAPSTFESRKKKAITKIVTTVAADLSDGAGALDPGIRGNQICAPMDDGTMDYVAADLANYYGAVLAVELELAQSLSPDSFSLTEAKAKSSYPTDPSRRKAWIEENRGADGKWSLDLLCNAGVSTDKLLMLTVKRQETKAKKEFAKHDYGVPAPVRLDWYRRKFLGQVQGAGAEPV